MVEPIISKNIRVRHPEYFKLGEGSIVDDFCYFSTKVIVGKYSHIANGCSVAGGVARTFSFGDYSSLSAGVKIWCTSNDFVNDLISITPPGMETIGDSKISGDVTIGNYTGVGSNAVIMPANQVPEGCAIGALSFVPFEFDFTPWTVYAGIPIKAVRKRNRDSVMRQVEKIEAELERRRKEGS